MPKIISHRGLINGPDKMENNPNLIETTLLKGFDCEIDIWIIEDKIYLGHDEPTYLISPIFLDKKGLWIHAKNLEALYWLTNTNLNYFWHQNDDYCITSKGLIWSQPGRKVTNKTIVVMPEWIDPNFEIIFDCFALCTDYPLKLRQILKRKNEK